MHTAVTGASLGSCFPREKILRVDCVITLSHLSLLSFHVQSHSETNQGLRLTLWKVDKWMLHCF